MTFLTRLRHRQEIDSNKSFLREIIHYVNPLDRIGEQKYSLLFPLFTSITFYVGIEFLIKIILHNSSLYAGIIIVSSIGLILYFSFRDAVRGGLIVNAVTIYYYFYIIVTSHVKGTSWLPTVQTAIILGIAYLAMGGVVGFLRLIIDSLIEREKYSRVNAETNERRLAAIMQQLPVGVLIVDKEKRRVEGNKQLVAFLGDQIQTRLRSKGSASKAKRGGKILSAGEWPITRALENGEVIISEEMEYIRKDKKRVFLRVSAAPIKDKTGQILAAVSTVDDITNKKQEEEAKYRLAALVESSEDAISSKTLDGIITTWNMGAEKLLGYSAREAIGKHINLIVPKKLWKQEEEIISKVRDGMGVKHFETMRLKKNGKTVAVSMSVSPVRNNEGLVIGASNITRDITLQKELEKQKDNFIATASHELKTPLTSLKGFTQIMSVLAKRKNDTQSLQFLGKMDSQLKKLANLVGDLLDVTKMQSGQLPLNLENYDFDEMLRSVVESMQLTTEKHVIALQGSIRQKVFGDRERTEQVVINLISNAIKYSPNAKEIIISAKKRNNLADISVRDFGIGIPKRKQQNIFKQFFRVSGPSTETFPGLGLGLYISNEIIKRLGGKIWVESVEGKGSTFHLEIPIEARKIA